ncbi:hypothetical protein [Pandoraea sp. CB10b_02]|uniref:hypothetical protein n=1 Tax=Pandoraea sp. CB10b_02 TaxID=2014535 RepID=UPI00258017DD|nr:hypothetical protein [Pandoraea sp. CB10b_02]
MTDAVIIKRKVRSDFTILPNDLIRDSRLSWGGLGLLVYVLHLPDNFRLRLSHLAKLKKCGRDATRARVKELEAAGYLTIRHRRNERGQYESTAWEVTDVPGDELAPGTEKPNTVYPQPATPTLEKPTLINTNTEQEQVSTNTTTTSAESSDSPLVLPQRLSASQAAAIRKELDQLPKADAQLILSELAWAMERGKIQQTPVHWVVGVVRKFRNGNFNPTAARKTTRQQVNPDQRSERPTAAASRAAAERHLPEIRAMLARWSEGEKP